MRTTLVENVRVGIHVGRSPSSEATLDSSKWRRYLWRAAAGSASLENSVFEVMKGEKRGCLFELLPR